MADSSFLDGLDLSHIPYQSPPRGVTSNFVDPETLGGSLIAVTAVSASLTLIFLSIRLYSTIFITRSAGSDDFMAVATFIFGVATAALNINIRNLSRHAWDVPLSIYTAKVSEIVFAEQIVIAIALFFSKMSILILLYRIFSLHKGFRYAVYVGMVWSLVISLVTIAVDLALCTPRPGEPFGSLETALRCTNLKYWVATSGVLIMTLDFYLFFLPIPMVWRLQMATRRKIGVTLIFMTGLIACVSSILGLYYKILFMNNNDPLWNSFKVAIVTLVEINVAVIVACMPACSSFYRRFSSQFTIFSSLRSRFTKSRSESSEVTLRGDAMEMRSKGFDSNTGVSSKIGTGKYWRLKNVLGRGGNAPQITFNKDQSAIMRTQDFDIYGESRTSLGRTPAPLARGGPTYDAHDTV